MESESFFADPIAEYRELIDFLGVRQWQPAEIDQHNARPGSRMPEEAREFLVEHYRPYETELADVLGRAPSWATSTR